MPDRSELDRRFAAAQADATTAAAELDRETERASAELLRQLKRQSVERRFEAIEDASLALVPVHRRELVTSVRAAARARPRLGAPTATSWEVFRSRLRFRMFALGVGAAAVATGLVLVGLAVHNTPRQWVTVDAAQAFAAQQVLPDGSVTTARVEPGERLVLTRIVGDQGELRVWVPGTGYAVLSVPLGNLRSAQ